MPRLGAVTHGLFLVLVLALVLPAGRGEVVIARVDQGGVSEGLLSQNSRILYLNQTAITSNSDVRSYLEGSLPGEAVVVTTNANVACVRLSGTSTGKLNIGILNLTRNELFTESMEETRPNIPGPPRVSKPADLPVFLGMGSVLVLAVLLLHPVGILQRIHGFPSLPGLNTDRSHYLLLFGVTLLSRVVYNIGYLMKFGWHANNVMELWFYIDVAKGNRGFLHPLNPTVHILRLFGILSPEKVPFYSTIACSMILASLVPVLVFILVKDLHGRRAGLYSGLIYAFLIQPMVLSTVSFTQHLTQIPLSILFLIFLNRAISSTGRRRSTNILLMTISAILGFFINVEILIYVFLGYLVVIVSVVRWLLRDHNRDTKNVIAIAMLIITLILMPVHLYFGELSTFSTGLTTKNTSERTNTELVNPAEINFVTAIPLSQEVNLRFYSIYFPIIPFGVYICWKRKDLIPYLLFAFGFVISLNWTRGSRITDLGISILAGIALAYFEDNWRLPLLFFATPLALITLLFFPASDLQPFVALGILFFVLAFYISRNRESARIALATGIIYTLSVTSVGFFMVEGLPQNQPMYDALNWLAENSQPGDRILTSLDRGHVPGAIADLESVSTEYDARPDVSKAFFETEEMAARTLAEHGITYILVSSDDLRIAGGQVGSGVMNFKGYVLFDQDFKDWEYPQTMAFRLTYPDKRLRYFEQLHEDERKGTTARIYRLKTELLTDLDRLDQNNRVSLSLMIRNPNYSPVKVWVPLSIQDDLGNMRSIDSISTIIGSNKTVSLSYDYALHPQEGLILSIDEGRIQTVAAGITPFNTFVNSSKPGVYTFSCILGNGSSYNFTTYLERGINEISHSLPYDGGEIALRSFTIVKVEDSIGDGRAMISDPLQGLRPVQIIFAQID